VPGREGSAALSFAAVTVPAEFAVEMWLQPVLSQEIANHTVYSLQRATLLSLHGTSQLSTVD
jgi:hypothetical protein